jgi:hypothetical protein
MSIEELRGIVAAAGGLRATARAAGCGVASIRRYLDGEVAIPRFFAVRLRMAEWDVRAAAAIGVSGTLKRPVNPC